MKTPASKNHFRWLLTVSAVIAVIVIYVAAFHDPGPGDEEEVVASGVDGPQPMTETKPSEVEPTPRVEQSIEHPDVADQGRQPRKQGEHGSESPLYFRVAFGEGGTKSMLGVFDESSGTGTGYNVAYIDENMNGDLADDAAKEFSRYKAGSRAGKLEPRFNFTGPFGANESAQYTLDVYALEHQLPSAVREDGYYFHWWMETKGWNYFFINGRARLYSSAQAALQGTPIYLGGDCAWEISSRTKDGKAMVSAGLKDGNGCTLRSVRQARNRLSPKLTLGQDGKIKAEEAMKFG